MRTRLLEIAGRHQDRRGNALIVVIIVMFVVMMIGLTLTDVSSRDMRYASFDWQREQAQAAADAGADYAIWYLGNNIGSWPPPATTTFTAGSYGPVTLAGSGASYTVSIASGTGQWNAAGDVVITSTGTMNAETVTVTVVCQPVGFDINVWSNAIFAGIGVAGGGSIDGHATIAGSVHFLGTGLSSGTSVFSGDGTGGIYNNYDDAGGNPFPSELPPEALTTTGKYTLNAHVFVKNGVIAMGGNKTIGTSPGSTGNKGSIDGAYATLGSSAYTGPVYSDNGTTHGYPLGNLVSFPDLLNNWPGTSTPTLTYINALAPGSATYTGDLTLSGTTTVNIGNVGDANYLYFHTVGSQEILEINGVVKVNGDVQIGSHNESIEFKGTGTIISGGSISSGAIVTPGNITVDGDFLPYGTYTGETGTGGFPINCVGFVAPGNIDIGPSAQSNIMGAFFAEGTAAIEKQTNVAGTVVGQYYDLGNPSAIFYVPDLENHLPAALPGGTPITFITGEQVLNYRVSGP